MIGIIEAAVGRQAVKEFVGMQAGDVKDTYADISAIQNDLGFVPTTTIDDGIPRFVDWFRRYHDM
jgi:UDP-glucuronate 4-epimerase